MSSHSQKYVERYSQGVILRDNSLREYNHFLRNLGENNSLEKIAAEYITKNGSCRILDVGCGNGQALHELKQHVGSLVHTLGIDLLPLSDSNMLDEFTQGDVHDVPLPTQCHLILSFRALHEMGNFSELLPRIAHALARAGRAYLWIRFREEYGNNVVFVGEMNAHEEAYLKHLSSQRELNGCNVLVEPVHVPHLTNGSTETLSQVVSGYVVLLMRP
jgi:SAM-dependent methyltransferase